MNTFLNELLVILFYALFVHAQTRTRGSCGYNVTGEMEGTITSRGYPNQYYSPNENCNYYVYAPENHVIVYSIESMDMEQPDEQGGKCLFDFVKIYDNDVRIHWLCGKQILYPNASSSNHIRVHFVSDFGKEGPGFELKWYVLDPNSRPIKLNCNFDDPIPLCAGWKNKNNEYPWYFTRDHTLSALTGPQFDHTTKNERGMYAYIEASGAARNITAVLVSPAILSQRTIDKRCVTLWYHMFGKGTGSLRIFLEDNDGRTLIAEYIGNKGDIWLESKNTITIRSLMSTISIEASRGMNYTSDIAIDDIDITEGDCDRGGRNVDLPPPFFSGTSRLLPNSIIPRTCSANLEAATCPADCDLTCDNFFQLSLSTCTRACYQKCACPDSFPIFHLGRCIDYSECPNNLFSIFGQTDAIAPQNTTQSVPSTTADTTITPHTTQASYETTAAEDETTKMTTSDTEKKKEVIHDDIAMQILQGIKSLLSNQNDN